MGKASSSKKIKRVQQAGASRTPGQRRALGFPFLIGAIIVVGLVLTAFAVQHRRNVEEVAPTVEDRWVEAYGTFICDEFITNFSTVQADAPIDLHDDGLIHVHPTDETNAGENALFALFAQSVGLQVADGTITLPDGTTYSDGDDCNGEEGRVALYVWPPQAGENTDPRVITTGIPTTRFLDDGQSYVLAFAPRGTEVPLPPSISRLDSPIDAEPEVSPQDSGADAGGEGAGEGDGGDGSQDTTTTAPEGGSTSAPDTTAGG